MPCLLPSPTSCYSLKLPELRPEASSNLTESEKRALLLDCRTGAAIALGRSSVFVYGGLTIPLALTNINSASLQQEIIFYFAREHKSSSSFQSLRQWVSRELFQLDLISRAWRRVDTFSAFASVKLGASGEPQGGTQPKAIPERLYHSMTFNSGYLYVFGGLVICPEFNYELTATNELWALDLTRKVWTPIASDPSITRRFNHEMHVVNGNDDDKDTLIVIVGGLDNMDRPVHSVDVYNVTQKRWESGEEASPESNFKDITFNIDGHPTTLVKDNNFSLVTTIDGVPSLAVFSPVSDPRDLEQGPLAIQPLVNHSSAVRLSLFESVSAETKRFMITSLLKNPVGALHGQTIIVAGFYPDVQPANYRCFSYSMATGSWSEVNVKCTNDNGAMYRLCQPLTWPSHHKILFLGTSVADTSSPSVQRFDKMLCISLPMANVINKGFSLSILKKNKKVEKAMSERSQDIFENYSRYIAPTQEITTTPSVFPSHAMALGKDSLELYGRYLSDFEIVTEEGDRVSVPLYLLRKRWGRYFDGLLAQGFVSASTALNSNVNYNEISKLSTDSSVNPFATMGSNLESTSSKEQPKCPSRSSSEQNIIKDVDEILSSHPLSTLLSKKSSPVFLSQEAAESIKHSFSDGKQSLTRGTSKLKARLNSETGNGSDPASQPRDPRHINSSAASQEIHTTKPHRKKERADFGMVFRMPFTESKSGSNMPMLHSSTSEPTHIQTVQKLSPYLHNRRKSSASVLFATDSNSQVARRASHPALFPDSSLGNNQSNLQTNDFSRKASIASQNSSISYVSSSSDRLGNSMYPHASNENIHSASSAHPPLNMTLPPQQPLPTDPIPAVPQQKPPEISASNFSAKNSPFSSRRSSLYNDITHAVAGPWGSQQLSSGLSNHGSDNQNVSPESQPLRRPSMERQFLEDYLIDVELESNTQNECHRPSFHRWASLSRESSTGKLNFADDRKRGSWTSEADSLASGAVHHPHYLEPSLTPRSLYMPWPTSTVKALAEFLYTGQVSGKWLLSPVALNLLMVAKLYQIPLLYDLMNEVLFSIVAKKEESLLLMESSFKQLFLLKVAKRFTSDEEKIENVLAANLSYQELLTLEKSLIGLGNGYVDLRALRKRSRQVSLSTSGSLDNFQGKSGYKLDKGDELELNIPILLASGLGDGDPSMGLPQYSSSKPSSSASGQSEPNALQVKNNDVEKELGPNYSKESSTILSPGGKRDELEKQRTAKAAAIKRGEQESNAEDIEQIKLHDISRNDLLKPSTQIIDARKGKGNDQAHANRILTKKSQKITSDSDNDDDDSSSSDSDFGDMSLAFGVASSSKLDQKIRERNVDESIDPLTTFNDGPGNSANKILNYFRQGEKYFKSEQSAPHGEAPTLDNIASPNSLPPVEYIIELIHKTSVMVGDVNLTIRCKTCLSLARTLKSLKQKLSHDLVAYDEELQRMDTPVECVERPTTPLKNRHESASVARPLTPKSSTEQLSRTNSGSASGRKSPWSSNREPMKKTNPSSLSQVKVAGEKASEASKFSSGTPDLKKQAKVKKINSHLSSSGLTGAGAGIFTTVPFAVQPSTHGSSGSRKKKEPSTNFSFFGKKK